MDINEAVKFLEAQIKDPKKGLPKEIFYFISKLTPFVNVDLLIKDENGRILLSWRDDIHGTGWHIPGGIVRFKEKMKQRIEKVSENEIGIKIKFNPEPISVKELICEHNIRGHFVSFLYKCFLSSDFIIDNKNLKETDQGYLKWHDSCPENLIKCHDMYREFI
tara:strand:- start:8409 stop:8897 length:489 start_codon:yes stop_codon:yes gene_type:complete